MESIPKNHHPYRLKSTVQCTYSKQVFANIGKTEVQGSSLGEGLETKGCPLSIPMASGRKLKKLRPGSLKKNYLIIYFLLKLASKYFTGGGVDSKSGPLPDFGLTAATV